MLKDEDSQSHVRDMAYEIFAWAAMWYIANENAISIKTTTRDMARTAFIEFISDEVLDADLWPYLHLHGLAVGYAGGRMVQLACAAGKREGAKLLALEIMWYAALLVHSFSDAHES
jgi:hypothetical protein